MICEHLAGLSDNLNPPSHHSKIYKDECTLCFDSCFEGDGIEVCLTCFNGGCTRNDYHGRLHFEKNASHVGSLRVKQVVKQKSVRSNGDSPPPQKITKLAVSAESRSESYDIEWRLICYKCPTVTFLREDVAANAKLQRQIDAILKANSSEQQSEIQAWELEAKPCEHVLALSQEPSSGINLSCCSAEGCDQTDNLWLCLTCGATGCGRQQPDGTGGKGHAMAHYTATKHPVCAKLGTITPEGNGDLYCYCCDDEVSDPTLGKHLKPLGINIEQQEKTAQTLAEIQLELNLKYDFSMTTEDGRELEALFGPGFTGLRNLGNSCYLASVMQCVADLCSVRERYAGSWGREHVKNCSERPESCLSCQMTKFIGGLTSGVYSLPDFESESGKGQRGVSPRMLKELVGRGHSEFASMRQQDAAEYLTYFSDTLEKVEKRFAKDSLSAMKFSTETRLQCDKCFKVRYTTENDQQMLIVPVPKSAESLIECLQAWRSPHQTDFSCPSCKTRESATVCTRVSSLPSVLAVLAQRFVFEDYTLQKRLNSVKVNTLGPVDFSFLREFSVNCDRQQELLLPEDSADPVVDTSLVSQIVSMGFSETRAIKALLKTGGGDTEAALNWLFAHMDDADIDDPLPDSGASTDSWSKHADKVTSLMEMGFTDLQSKKALLESSFNVERAIEWVFSNCDMPITEDDVVIANDSSNSTRPIVNPNQSSSFELFGVISHKGSSTQCGHYVCHLQKIVKEQGRQWVLFNDNRVVKAPNFETDFGYLYFFRQN